MTIGEGRVDFYLKEQNDGNDLKKKTIVIIISNFVGRSVPVIFFFMIFFAFFGILNKIKHN